MNAPPPSGGTGTGWANATLAAASVVLAACSNPPRDEADATTAFGVDATAVDAMPDAIDAAPVTADAAGEPPAAPAPGAGTVEVEQEHPVGLVYYFTANVREEPTIESTRLGHVRRGTLLRVDGPVEGSGCPDGWYRLVDTRGYICSSEGLKFENVSRYLEQAAPHRPWFESVLPYDYGHIMKNDLPAYNRIPTQAERKEVAAWLAERRAVIEAQRDAVEEALEQGSVLPNPYEVTAEVENPDGSVEKVVVEDAYEQDVDEGPVPTEIPFNYVEKIMLRGFYVSLNKRVWREGSSWYKTVRGLYVRARNVHVISPPMSRGAELGGDATLPVGIVMRKKVNAYSSQDGGTTITPAKPMAYHRFDVLPIVEEVTTRGRTYYHVGGGHYVRRGDVRRVDASDPPGTVKEPGQKWMDVDIGKQVLVAYEGTSPVYVALVSSGRERENLEYKTPRGIHAVVSKHVTGTMDNLYASDGPYAIEDVPWTMYFLGSYALHGAFWHNGFGRVRSHGCINLSPWDARWLFYWADPQLPADWHSVYASKGAAGTIIRVRD
jgi:lipoprotein-anchoring transpeptidase ErfK/SrfK